MQIVTTEMRDEICAKVRAHRRKKERWQEILDCIFELRERSEFFTEGGDKMSETERSCIMYEKARKRFAILAEDVEGVEKALNGVAFAQDDENYGVRLAHAILLECEGFASAEILIAEQELKEWGDFISPQQFRWHKTKFIEDLAHIWGYVGGVEMLLFGV